MSVRAHRPPRRVTDITRYYMKQTRPCLASESIKVSGDKCFEMHHTCSWLRVSSVNVSVETLLGDMTNPRGGKSEVSCLNILPAQRECVSVRVRVGRGGMDNFQNSGRGQPQRPLASALQCVCARVEGGPQWVLKCPGPEQQQMDEV